MKRVITAIYFVVVVFIVVILVDCAGCGEFTILGKSSDIGKDLEELR